MVIGLVPLLLLGTLAWAVWQRAQTDLSAAVAESQQRVLDVLATGDPVDWSSAEGIQGDIATDGEVVAVNLVGIPELRVDEGLVVWLLDGAGDAVTMTSPYLPSQVGGTLVAALPHPASATEVVISIETDLPEMSRERPEGYRVLTGRLPAPAPAGG